MKNATGTRGFSEYLCAFTALMLGCAVSFGAPALAAADAKPKDAKAAPAKPSKPAAKPGSTTGKPATPKPAPRKPAEKPAFPGFAAAEKGDWREVRRLIAAAPKAPLSKVLTWMMLRAPGSGSTYFEIRSFADANPTWPDRNTLARRSEEAIWTTASDDDRQRWFSTGKAYTREGAMWLAEAAERSGRDGEAAKRYRDLWSDETFSADQERAFLAAKGEWIRPEDHKARLNRLIWERRFGEAHRQLERVDADTRNVGEARIALATMNSGAANALLRVPNALRSDPGLIYEHARWLRRNNKDDEAVIVLLGFKGERPNPGLWWDEQAVLARDALADGRISQAYGLAAQNDLKSPGDLAEAEWLAGWIAFQFLKDPGLAEGHFKRLYDNVSTPVSRSRGAYWLGRAATGKGDATKAAEWYAKAAEEPTTFYGQLAAQHSATPSPSPLVGNPAIPREATAWAQKNELGAVLKALDQNGGNRLIPSFGRALYYAAHTDDQRLAAVELVSGISISQGVRLARLLRQGNVRDTALAYPVPKWIELPDAPSPAMVLGIIRQESNFDVEAESSAGAKGLMQLMPKTAEREARMMNQPYTPAYLTGRPNTNVRLGSHYLGRLLDRYDGYPALAFAAYNAGESRVDQWLRTFGDPRTGDIDLITWIECIPFKETRNYVQRVLENAEIYRHRVGGAPIRVADNP